MPQIEFIDEVQTTPRKRRLPMLACCLGKRVEINTLSTCEVVHVPVQHQVQVPVVEKLQCLESDM